MGKFRKKPIIVEAFRLPLIDEDASDELMDFLHSSGHEFESDRDGGILINTLEGVMRGEPGDWIIMGIREEIYPCKPDIFEVTYEKIEETKL